MTRKVKSISASLKKCNSISLFYNAHDNYQKTYLANIGGRSYEVQEC